VFKVTTRTEAQLAWLAGCAPTLRRAGVSAPMPQRGEDGRFVQAGWTCEPFVRGRPLRYGEKTGLRSAIRRVHRQGFGLRQRPGFLNARAFLEAESGGDVDLSTMPRALVARLRAAFEGVPRKPLTLVHGGLGDANIAVRPWGQYVLYDWDAARLDHPLFDLVACGAIDNPVPGRAALAFEIATRWHRQRDYAMSLAERL